MKFEHPAFISYSHKDKYAAIRLHRALEKIRFPKQALSTGDKSLFPVFIDEEEMLSGVKLDEELKRRLRQSQFLIVICTPESARSESVAFEISYFKSLPQGDNVIPVILDRHELVQHKAFPEALDYRTKGKFSLALNLGGDKHFDKKVDRLVLMKIAASLTRLPLHELWSRERNRQRRNFVLTVMLVSSLVTLPILYWDLSIRNFESDFKNFYRSPKGWVGIDKVNVESGAYYRFKRIGRLGKTVSVTNINKNGKCDRLLPTTEVDLFSIKITSLHYSNHVAIPFCSASFDYRVDGTISKERIYTSLSQDETDAQLIEEFNYPDNICTLNQLTSLNSSYCEGDLRNKFRTIKLKVAFDAGKLVGLTAIDASVFKSSISSLIEKSVARFSYGSQTERLEKLEYTNFNNDFLGAIEFGYSESGYLNDVYINGFEEKQDKALSADRFSFTFDKFGRLKTRKVSKGNRLVSQQQNSQLVDAEQYPENSDAFYLSFFYPEPNQVETRFIDSFDRPARVNAVHSIVKTQNGSEMVWRNFDLDDEPIEDADGVHQIQELSKRMSQGFKTTRKYFNLSGQPVIGPSGYHMQTTFTQDTYSSRGLGGIRLTPGIFMNEKRFDEEIELIEGSRGVAYLSGVFNKEGQVVELGLYNAYQDYIENDLGIARVKWDSHSNTQSCFSADDHQVVLFGQRANNSMGWEELSCASESYPGYTQVMSQKISSVDKRILAQTFAQGLTLEDRYIVAHKEFEYKAQGVYIEKITNFVQNHQLEIDDLQTWQTWNNGSIIESALHDADTGERRSDHQGYSFSRIEHDRTSAGNSEIVSFFKLDESPLTKIEVSAHRFETVRDYNNRILRQAFYDESGALRAFPFASFEYRYLNNGGSMLVSAFDENGKAVNIDFGGDQIRSVVYTDKNEFGLYTRKYFNQEGGQKMELKNGTYYIELSPNPLQGGMIWTSKTKHNVTIASGVAVFGPILAW